MTVLLTLLWPVAPMMTGAAGVVGYTNRHGAPATGLVIVSRWLGSSWLGWGGMCVALALAAGWLAVRASRKDALSTHMASPERGWRSGS
jgi:hypothetical protein